METRASYLAVGAFVIVVAIGLLGFVVWLGAGGASEEDEVYIIDFAGTVTGLSVGSPVRYRGIPVGEVADIVLNPENLQEVRVTISVRRDTPIVTDNVASLELQGITGGIYVLIAGGSAGSPRLQPGPDGEPPEIASMPSTIEAVVQSFPEVLEQVTAVLDRANRLLSDDNLAAIDAMVADVGRITAALADPHSGVPALTDRAAALAQGLDELVMEARIDLARLSDVAIGTLETTDQQVAAIGNELTQAAQIVRRFAAQVDVLLQEARPGLTEFSQTGLYEFTLMVSELRGLATTLTRVTEQFERDPAQFILGQPVSGVDVR